MMKVQRLWRVWLWAGLVGALGMAGCDGTRVEPDPNGSDAGPTTQDAGSTCTANTDCDDGIACTTGTCTGGTCSFAPDHSVCNDNNPCTVGNCEVSTGCVQANAADSTSCTNTASAPGVCEAGACVECTMPSDCPDPEEECVVATCTGNTCGSANAPAGTPCTYVDGSGLCQSGTCEGLVDDKAVFRVSSLVLADPHIVMTGPAFLRFFCEPPLYCNDITNEPFAADCAGLEMSFPPVNSSLMDSVTSLELNLMLVFDPLDQGNGTGGQLTVREGDCLDAATCMPLADGTPQTVPYTSKTSGTCLAPLGGTANWDGDPTTINTPSGNCFVSEITTFLLIVAIGDEPLAIPLEDAQIAGTYVGDPATGIADGLAVGFLSQEQANATEVTVGGLTINLGQDLLLSDDYECSDRGYASDLDVHDGMPGYWFYLNYTAALVPNGTGF
jgi:hypothetical protein